MSHQLRTPLTALQLRLEELRHLDDPALIHRETDHAVAEADRLERTITDLLSAARSERTQGAGGPLDLRGLIQSHASTWVPLFERAGRRLETKLRDAPPAHASAGAVGQALDVLLENALHHGAGRVVLRLHERAGRPAMSVTDEGDAHLGRDASGAGRLCALRGAA